MSGERTRRVAVVGGGLAGLAAARRLCARGDLDVVVWEAADRPGGVIATSVADGFAREHGPNGFLTGAAGGGAELAAELGVPVEPASPAAQRRWVFRGGQLRPVPSGPLDLVRAELVSWRGLLHALGEPFRPPRLSGPEETVAEFARRRLGEEVLEALVAPFCAGVFAGDANQLSLRAAFPKLAALEAEGGLVRGSAVRMLRRMLGQERSGPGAAPGRPRLAAPQGGMAALVATLAREIGPRLKLGCPAVAIELEAGGRARALRFADGRREAYDAVVLAMPAPAAARLVSDASLELARLLDSIPYVPVAVVHLGYRRADLPAPAVEGAGPPGWVSGASRLDGFGFLVAGGEDLRILGAVFESVIWPSRAPDDHLLIRCILGGTRDPAVLELGDGGLVEQAERDLERALGLGARPVHRHVVRWPRAIAQYTVGHLDRVARADELAEQLGVVLAGASYHGVAVNSCAADASRVAHRVAARLGLAPALLLGVAVCAAHAAACSTGAEPGGPSGAAGRSDAGSAVELGAGSELVQAAAGGGSPEAESREPDEPPAAPSSPGSIDVAVEWLRPPAELVSSTGRNRCGVRRRPPLLVSSLGGVEGAVVRLEGVSPPARSNTGEQGVPAPGAGAGKGKRHREGKGKKAPAEPAEIAVRGCQMEPRALRVRGPGTVLALTSFDEKRHQIALDSMPEGKGEAVQLASVPLVLVGHRVELDIENAGLVRVSSAADPESAAWVLVPEHAYVGLSDERGRVRFDDVPAGRYEVSVWHPPVGADHQPIKARAAVEVAGGESASATVSLAPVEAARSDPR